MKTSILLSYILLIFMVISSVNLQASDNNRLNHELLVVGDFDNNGLTNDILFISSSAISTVRCINDNFEFEQPQFDLPADLSDISLIEGKVVAGDFDNDGFCDDIAGMYSTGVDKTSFTVWVNNDGHFIPSQWWYGGDFNAEMVTNTLIAGDFDNDGYIDDVVGFYNYDQLKTKAFVWNSTGKKFEWPRTWWIGGDFDATRIQSTMVTGDFDHDGFCDDIAGLYNYSSDRCKIFVWESTSNRFEWPYTWYNKENFKVSNIKGSVIAGDFDQNGYVDDIAALYRNDSQSTKILVWQLQNNSFNDPDSWWYGQQEGTTTQDRLVALDANNNKIFDQITGLSVEPQKSTWLTWTAMNHSFTLPVSQSFENSLLGITENTDKEKNPDMNNTYLSIYPNPASSSCKLTLPGGDEMINIELINTLGSIVYQTQGQPDETITLDLEQIKSGTYLIRISNSTTDIKQYLVKE